MTLPDRTTNVCSDLPSRVTGPLSRRSVSLAGLALLMSLTVGCSDSASPEPTEEGKSPAEADDAEDESDESTSQRDAGAKADAGRKDAGRDASDTKPTPTKDAGATSDAAKPVPTGDAGPTPVVPPPADGTICARWKSDRVSLSEGTWTGNAEACQAGDMAPEARATALRLLNTHRFMAGLPAVTATAAGDKLAQDCALLMRANNTITHTPPTTFKCYTAEAAKTANSSSLSSGPAVGSVDGYMIDPGNPTTIGHRRWILSNWLTEVGFGSADRFSCQYQPAKPTRGGGGKPWAAWPPGGEVPIQAFGGRFLGTIDQTGWTIQSDSINLASAKVTVTSGGADKPVTVTQLGGGYGSMYALRFNPMGWTSKAGETYSVKVEGTSMPIAYDVKVVDCP